MLAPLLAAPALAADAASVRPFVWVRPAWTWIADDPSNPSAQDGFTAEARLGVDAHMPDVPVAARVEVALLPEPTLTDAYLSATPVAWLTLRAGQLKVPFSIHTLASDTRRQLPGSVPFLDAAKITRQIGASADLAIPYAGRTRAVVSTGAFNGEGPNRIQNVNQRLQFVERVLLTPLGARETPFEGTDRSAYLGIGGGWIYDYAGDGIGAEESNTFGLEIQAAWSVLSFQAEALDQEIVHANVATTDYHVQGLYGQLGAFVPAPWARDHVEVVGRFEADEPNTAFGDTSGESLPAFQATWRGIGGVNLYLRADPARFHDLKLQAAYTHVEALEGDELPDDSFTLDAVARF